MGVFKQSKNIYQFISGVKKLNKSINDIEQEKAAHYIQDLLEREGGLFSKVVQYMGTQNQKMQTIAYENSKEVLSIEEVKKIVGNAYPDEQIEVSNEAYSASIGQVNRAIWKEQDIAVKIRYPGIKKTLTDQLRILNILPKLDGVSPAKKWGFDYGMYQREFERLLNEECDYTREAEKLGVWSEYLNPILGVRVPRVFSDYTREDIYLQEFIKGQDVLDAAALWSPLEKRKAAEKLIHAFLHLLFKHQVAQGDSNFGNYKFLKGRGEPEVVMIDLGQSVQFSHRFTETLFSGLKAFTRNEPFSALGFFKGLGFDTEKLKAIGQVLPLLLQILFEPLLSNRPINLAQWNYKKDIDTLLGENKWWFRSSGGVEFFLFMKAFMGLKNICIKLNANINWRQLFEEVAVGLDVIAIEEIDTEAFPNYQSRHLKINITEKGQEKVNLKLPFMTLFSLDEYLSDEVRALIKNNNYDLESVIKEALADGGLPKDLVFLEEGIKSYRVSIE